MKRRRLVERTRLGWRDVAAESVAGLTVQPGRTILTLAGVALGIGMFVAVMGLTATASGQISAAFSVLRATEVTLTDAGGTAETQTVYSFPPDADASAQKLNAVVAAGRTWDVPGSPFDVRRALDPRTPTVRLALRAASPGYLRAIGASVGAGALPDEFSERSRLHTAVLGRAAARDLGITTLNPTPTIFLGGSGYVVTGIMQDVSRDPGILGSVVIPAATALATFGEPSAIAPARMVVATRLGAADQVAQELPLALRPDRPELMRVDPVAQPSRLEDAVSGSLRDLFLVLAAVTLLIGAAGIANLTLVAVLQRTREIGLRRALGARPKDVVVQFLAESATLGLLGGLIGTALGNLVVIGTALANAWTALLDPWVTLGAPALGAVTGLLAGLFPAQRAARISPVEALRR